MIVGKYFRLKRVLLVVQVYIYHDFITLLSKLISVCIYFR